MKIAGLGIREAPKPAAAFPVGSIGVSLQTFHLQSVYLAGHLRPLTPLTRMKLHEMSSSNLYANQRRKPLPREILASIRLAALRSAVGLTAESWSSRRVGTPSVSISIQ